MTIRTRRCKTSVPAANGVITLSLNEAGDYAWNLKSKANGQVILTPGEGFETARACAASIANARRDMPKALILVDPEMAADIKKFAAIRKAGKTQVAPAKEGLQLDAHGARLA